MRSVRRLLCVAVVGMAAGGFGVWWLTRQAPLPAARVTRLEAGLPAGHHARELAVSPDGTRLAYTAEAGGPPLLFVRAFDSLESIALEGTTGAHQPFFSPDGAWLAFFAGDELRRVSVGGGPIRTICPAPVDSAGGSWAADGRIVFAPLDGRGLVIVSAEGGTPEPLTRVDRANGEVAHGWPHVLPDGAGVVLSVARAQREPRVAVLRWGEAAPRLLVPVNGPARYVSSGHLVYEYLGQLQALSFDVSTLESQGVPTPVARGVAGSPRGFDTLGFAAFAASNGGTIAFLPGSQSDPATQLVWVDRDGEATLASETVAVHQTPRLAPDGRQLAVVVHDDLFSRNVWLEHVREGRRTRLTFQGGENHAPVWSPDGRELAFASNRLGPQNIFVRAIASAGDEARRVIPGDGVHNPASWRAGVLALYEVTDNGGDIWLLESGGRARPVLATPANERAPALSPDVRWLAYTSDVSGTDAVYVRATAGGVPRQVSEAGGTEPVWSRDGRELFYRHGDRMMAATIEGAGRGGEPEISARTLVFERGYERDPGGGQPSYDVAADGRFLMLRRAGSPPDLQVILDWGR